MGSTAPRPSNRWAPSQNPSPSPPSPPSDEQSGLDAVARRGLGSVFQFERLIEQRPGTVVYLAYEADRKRPVILRVYDRAELEVFDRLESLQQAVSELAALRDPAIVPIGRSGLGGHTYWWSTQVVRAPSLADLVRTAGPLPLARLVAIVAPVARALAHAHELGLSHGDVRPDNIVVAADDSGLIKDFIVADGPELVEKSPSGDQRALAITICRCLTGDLDSSDADVEADLGSADAVMTRCSDLDPPMATALVRAAESRPSAQFRSIGELISALRPLPPPGQATHSAPETYVPRDELDRRRLRRKRRIAAVAVIAVLVAWAGSIWWNLKSAKPTTVVASSPLARPQQLAARDSNRPVPAEPIQPLAQVPSESAASAAAPPTPVLPDTVPTLADTQSVDSKPSKVSKPEPAPVAVRPETRRARPRIRAPAPARLGILFVKSRPSGTLYIDNRRIGSTPKSNLRLPAGSHVIRVERPLHRKYFAMIDLGPGKVVRLDDIVLQPH